MGRSIDGDFERAGFVWTGISAAPGVNKPQGQIELTLRRKRIAHAEIADLK